MKRDEFIENITDWDDLVQFAYDEEIESQVEDLYTASGISEYVESILVDLVRENTWDELRDLLNEVPTDYSEWYIHECGTDFSIADWNDFDNYKDDILSEGDRLEIWDEEDNEVEDEAEPGYTTYETEIDMGYTVGQEDISIAELFSLDNLNIEDNRLCSLEV